MIDSAQIREILSLYKKHGWKLRRVLLTEMLKNSLADSAEILFAGAELYLSEIDAAWFSRASGAEREAWEIRHLNETPYALVEIFDAEDEEEIRAERRLDIEEQLKTVTVGSKFKDKV